MDILSYFLRELSGCFSRPIVLGEHRQVDLPFPLIVLNDLSLRKEQELYLLSGRLEIVSPLEKPLQIPQGAPQNPSVELGMFLDRCADFRGSFEGQEILEVFRKDGTLYNCLSIRFHGYPLRIPEIFSIQQVVSDSHDVG